ncbi:MAG: radical SAM protein [Thermodesulfobacteriota bacterium]
MHNPVIDPVTLSELQALPKNIRIFWRILRLLISSENRSVRAGRGLTFGDALFNVLKCVSLDGSLRRYRHAVQFGEQMVLDSTFPPFPSAGFDRRISNYLNNLDMTEMPSGIISISTTNSCPYACAFCSTNATKTRPDDLDEELLKSVITQVERLGVPMIILHGGEPLYRYDRFLRLVKHVTPKTCLWMFTTGYGATPEKARELKENGLFGVWVSLDHCLPEVHNRLRGHAEAFDNACRAVEYFKDAGVYTCLSLVPPEDLIVPENFKKYYDMAKALGVAEIRVMEKKPSGREACRGVTPHSPVLAQLQKDLYADPAYADHPPLSGLSTWLEKDQSLGCQCRFEYLFITSTGEVQPCEASECSFGNIREEEFLDVYRRACEAFQHPSTGCIPMAMYDEVRDYCRQSDHLTSPEKGEISTRIIQGFEERGTIPGAFSRLWPMYERRLKAYRKRRKASQAGWETQPKLGSLEPQR